MESGMGVVMLIVILLLMALFAVAVYLTSRKMNKLVDKDESFEE
ncbi:hypothetical protein FITA111629_03580 [Filibacter tadaridae]|uniref:Uncharacterized protein n=1 Tax=Filibacter tadaridae TaxID=2483811 RepID=A0A3P5XG17_9BACL|nr:hypothetical protein [Filibacter tadaridae]VDC27538.1 hypothetical protein FILTAD_01634 [Filibacter tadaridae]